MKSRHAFEDSMQMRKTLAKVTPFSHKYLHHLVLSQIDKSSCHFFFFEDDSKSDKRTL